MSHIFCWTRGALKTTEGKAEVPSLDLSEVERTTPVLMFRPTGLTLRAAPPKERDHFT